MDAMLPPDKDETADWYLTCGSAQSIGENESGGGDVRFRTVLALSQNGLSQYRLSQFGDILDLTIFQFEYMLGPHRIPV